MDEHTRRFFKTATIIWCVTPFIAFIATPPVPIFCEPGEQGLYWYNVFSLGAVLLFPLCFSALIFSRIALELGYERAARGFMFAPLIGIAAYLLIAIGLRAYWGEALRCLWIADPKQWMTRALWNEPEAPTVGIWRMG